MFKGEYQLLPTEIQSENGMVMTKFSILFLFLVFFVLSANSFGTDWVGGGADRLWSTGANWNGGSEPGAADQAKIKNASFADDPIIDSTVAAACNDLFMGGATGTDILTMTGGTLDVSDIIEIGTTNGYTTVIDMSNGTMNLNGTGNCYMGKRLGAFTLNMTGGTINAGNFAADKNVIWAAWETESVTEFNISDGEFNVATELWFGDKGHTTVNQTGGAVSAAEKLMLDRNNNDNDTVYNLNGGTCYADNIGLNGNSILNIAGGTLIIPKTRLDTVNAEIGAEQIVAYLGKGTVDVDSTTDPVNLIITAVCDPIVLGQAWQESPTDGAVNVALDAAASWTAGYYATSHDVYFGTDYDDVSDTVRPAGDASGDGQVNMVDVAILAKQWYDDPTGKPEPYADLNSDGDVDIDDLAIVAGLWMEQAGLAFKGNQPLASNIYDPSGFAIGTTYYWRIDERDAVNVYEGDVWSFTTNNPYQASAPSPVDGTFGVATDAILSWTAGTNAISHNVYFGTNSNPPFIQNQPAITYDPPGDLVEGQTYYWRIDEYDGATTWQGDVWSFTAYNLSAPVWNCNTFTLEFDGDGYVSSIFYKPTSRELVSVSSGNEGFTVYNDGPEVRLTKVNRTAAGKLLARSADDSRQVLLGVVERDKHIAFRIEELVGMPTSENAKLRFNFKPNSINMGDMTTPLQIPAWYGEGIGIGPIALDWMTCSYKDFKLEWKYLWHRADDPSDPIGGFAIFVCDENETLNTLGQIEIDEGLYHPMNDGEWAKINNVIARQTQMWISFDGVNERDEMLGYFEESGFGMFYPVRWSGTSIFTADLTRWPNGVDDLRDLSDTLHAMGRYLGIHTASSTLKKNDTVYVSPIPDDRLYSWCTGTLSGSIDSDDTSFYFTPGPNDVIPTLSTTLKGLRPPTYFNAWKYDRFRVGDEIILVGDYDDSSIPWHMTGCTRGQNGTSAAAHTSGATGRGLLAIFGDTPGIDPDSTLFQETADVASAFVNACGIDRVTFDALASVDMKGLWAMEKWVELCSRGFDHPVAADSGLGQAWHLLSLLTIGDGMHHYPEGFFNTWFIPIATAAKDAFLPPGLGGYSWRLDGESWHASTPDEWEWWLGKTIAYDATWRFDVLSPDHFRDHGQTHEILALCNKWDKIRLSGVVPQAQRDAMKDHHMSYRLTSSGESDTNWEISPTKIVPKFVQLDDSIPDANIISLDNPFAAQPLRFEARVLGSFDYNSGSNVDLLPSDVSDFSIPTNLSVVKIGDEWTFSTTGNGGSVQADYALGSTLNLTNKRGVGLYVTGDGNGGYFYVEFKEERDKVLHYVIPNDFTGRKYVEIPTFEVCDYLYLDHLYELWPHSSNWYSIKLGFHYDKIVGVSYGFIDVPSGQTASVTIEGVKALQENAASLDNLSMATGGGTLSVTGSVANGNYLVYEGGSTATVLNANRQFVSTLPVSTANWQKSQGSSQVSLDCSSTTKPWLKVLFKTLDTPFNIANPVNTE